MRVTSLVRKSRWVGALASLSVVGALAVPATSTAATTPTLVVSGTDRTCAVSGGLVSCWGGLQTGVPVQSVPTVVSVSTVYGVTAVAVGSRATCAVLTTGTVRCWGQNYDGQLGIGNTTNSATPVSVPGLAGATAVASEGDSFCALLSTGAVKCWGNDDHGQLGNNHIGGISSTPVTVQGVSGATTVSVGLFHACAVVTTGSVKCWGDDESGQLGDSSTTTRAVGSSILGVSNAKAVAAGLNFTCVLLTTGVVRCAGADFNGQLGDGIANYNDFSTQKSYLVTVEGLSGATSILASQSAQACALLTSGSVTCWGQIETATGANNASTPHTVSLPSGVTTFSLGSGYGCAVVGSTDVRCWGNDYNGELGNGKASPAVGGHGTTADEYTYPAVPVAVPNLTVTSISTSPSLVAGQPIHFTAVVKNTGNTATPAGVVVGVNFKIDGLNATWSDTDTTSLAPGASVTLTANSGPTGSSTWTATHGTHTLLATVDDVDRMAELDKTDNTLTKTLVVP